MLVNYFKMQSETYHHNILSFFTANQAINFEVIQDYPQQQDAIQCGIFTLSMAESIIAGRFIIPITKQF